MVNDYIYFAIKTDKFFIIFTLKNIEMTTIFNFILGNIVPWLYIKARGCCMHVFLVVMYFCQIGWQNVLL